MQFPQWACGDTMTDLQCVRCGEKKSYADATIADIHKTCERHRTADTTHGTREVTVPAKHEWREM